MNWCPWLSDCFESTTKGGASFVQVCLGLNAAQATWKTYRQQYEDALNHQKEKSSDVASDLIDSLKNANRLSRGFFKVYISINKAIDISQRIVLWAVYILSIFCVLWSLWMLYFDRYSEWDFCLLFPPLIVPVLFFVIRWLIGNLGMICQHLLKVPSGKEMASEISSNE